MDSRMSNRACLVNDFHSWLIWVRSHSFLSHWLESLWYVLEFLTTTIRDLIFLINMLTQFPLSVLTWTTSTKLLVGYITVSCLLSVHWVGAGLVQSPGFILCCSMATIVRGHHSVLSSESKAQHYEEVHNIITVLNLSCCWYLVVYGHVQL